MARKIKLLVCAALLALLLAGCPSSRWAGAYMERGSGTTKTLYFPGDFCPSVVTHNGTLWDLVQGSCNAVGS